MSQDESFLPSRGRLLETLRPLWSLRSIVGWVSLLWRWAVKLAESEHLAYFLREMFMSHGAVMEFLRDWGWLAGLAWLAGLVFWSAKRPTKSEPSPPTQAAEGGGRDLTQALHRIRELEAVVTRQEDTARAIAQEGKQRGAATAIVENCNRLMKGLPQAESEHLFRSLRGLIDVFRDHLPERQRQQGDHPLMLAWSKIATACNEKAPRELEEPARTIARHFGFESLVYPRPLTADLVRKLTAFRDAIVASLRQFEALTLVYEQSPPQEVTDDRLRKAREAYFWELAEVVRSGLATIPETERLDYQEVMRDVMIAYNDSFETFAKTRYSVELPLDLPIHRALEMEKRFGDR